MNPVNPAAGDVPYPTDPLEIELAQRSARVLWRAFPYFEIRYGARGKRFGASDAGYLVAFARTGELAYRRQAVWLAGLLANRGMPSWLLECQLHHIVRIGARRQWRYAPIVSAGVTTLVELRRQSVDDIRFERLARQFTARAQLPQTRSNLGMGKMVVSAFADERCGIVRSSRSFTDWVAARDRPDRQLRDAIDYVQTEVVVS